jgi:protocatechuate 3,4-dioxygenase beta subunit
LARPALAETAPNVPPAAAAQTPGLCVLFPQAVEGPYYFDPKLVRGDIAEGRPGMPLDLTLRIVETGTCDPIADARVDIWHADARGVYSGYGSQGDDRKTSTRGETYLRGTQMSDANGDVKFRSIYPGWYPGRTPHIHVKAFLDKKTVLTGQVYFPDALSARIYREREPYNARPVADTANTDDFIFKTGEREGGGTIFTIEEKPEAISAALIIAVDRSGDAARKGGGWRGFMRSMFGR